MAEMPWSKFFWSDWESDQGLRLCSLAAQGLWMRMLCVCARHEPKGYLSINGNPLKVDAIARLAGVAETEAETLVAELELNGVFSRNRAGCIYSRRMVKDERRSQEGRKHKKRGLSQSTEKMDENPSPSRGASRGPSPQKPDARIQIEDADAASARATLGFIELVCEAAGGRFGDPSPSGSVLGLGQDEADAVRRWQSDLGLTQDEILMEVRRQAARKRGGPVKSLTYFTAGMKDRAGQKQADAALMPTIQRPTNGDRNGDTEPSAGRGASGSTHPGRGKRPGGIVGAAMRHYSGREA